MMKKVFLPLLLLSLFAFKTQAQISCPDVTAYGDTTLCTASCVDIWAEPVSGATTTQYYVQQIPYNPYPYQLSNIIVPVNIGNDDEYSPLLPLSFDFCFYGNSYNQCVVGTNGVVTFDPAQANGYCPYVIPAAIPSNLDPMNAIFTPWHDIDPSVNANEIIAWDTFGVAPCRVMVISWYNVPMYSSICNNLIATQQVVLYETTNIIEINIENKPLCTSWENGAAIEGIQNATGTVATVVPGRNLPTQWTAQNDSWRFVPDGAPNYTVTWFNNGNQVGNTDTINVCPSQSEQYIVQVDYTHCNNTIVTVFDTVNIVVNNVFAFNVVGVDETCLGASDGTATANVTMGNGPFTYTWSNGGNTQTIGNLAPGTYYVTVEDIQGCSGVDSVLIGPGGNLTVSVTTTDETCPLTADGSAQALPNGVGPYTYAWSNGQNTASITGLATGTYTVTVSNAAGCTGTASGTVGVGVGPTADAGPDVSFCEGEGGALLSGSVTGGAGAPYYYSWSCQNPPCGLDSLFDDDPLANPTSSQWFYLQVTDASGCTSPMDSVYVTVHPKPSANAGPDLYLCQQPAPGGNLQGSVTGGTGPFAYLWSPGAGLNDSTIANPYARPDTTTIYTLVVTDLSTGCSSDYNTLDTVSTVTVHVKPRPVAEGGPDRSICEGDTIMLQGIGTGGDSPNYDFEWTPGNSLSDSSIANPLAFPSLTTEYVLVVWNDGCASYGDTVRVDVNPTPTVNAGPNRDICYGESAQLDGMASANGVSNFSFYWTPGNTLSDSTVEDPVATPTVTTTYSMVAESPAGCVSEPATVLVTVNPSPIADAGTDFTWCAGSPLPTLDGSVLWESGVSGNPGNVIYSWEPSGSISGASNLEDVLAEPGQSMYFYFTVTHLACSSTDSVLVTVLPEINAGADADTSMICGGDSVQLYGTGGAGGASFVWSPNGSLSDGNTQNPMAAPDSTTEYMVIVSEGGCTDTAYVSVNVLPTPVSEVLSSLSDGCAPHTVNFLQTATNGISYTWDFGDGTISNDPNPTHTYTDPGHYYVTLTTTGLGGCADVSDTFDIYVADTAIAGARSAPPHPATLPMPAQIPFFEESINGTNFYWDFGDGTFSTDPNPVHSYEYPGTYFVTLHVTNAMGCESIYVLGPYEIFAPGVFIPNVFSPNGDGIMDDYRVDYTGNQPYSIEIYDRWGVLMFTSTNKMDFWDGTYNGTQAPEGDYYYHISIGPQEYTGSFTLVR